MGIGSFWLNNSLFVYSDSDCVLIWGVSVSSPVFLSFVLFRFFGDLEGFLIWVRAESRFLAMRKRERENPCGVCGHYHKYEEGEVCGICGHRVPATSEKTSLQVSAFPSEILPEFLYLGSYDNASRSELLKTQGISRVLNVCSISSFSVSSDFIPPSESSTILIFTLGCYCCFS